MHDGDSSMPSSQPPSGKEAETVRVAEAGWSVQGTRTKLMTRLESLYGAVYILRTVILTLLSTPLRVADMGIHLHEVFVGIFKFTSDIRYQWSVFVSYLRWWGSILRRLNRKAV